MKKAKNRNIEVPTISAHFDRKYGLPGTSTRIRFEQKAEAYRVAQLARKPGKKLK